MRILYDHQAFTLQNTGGITLYFYELLKYLRTVQGVETTTLLGYSSTKWPLQSQTAPPNRLVHWGPRPVASGMATFVLNELLLNPLVVVSGQFDVYHNTLYRFMPGARATARVATHHDCVHERFPELFPDSGRIVRTKARMFHEADLILCVSSSSRDDLLHFYDVDPARTLVVHNGVSPPQRTSSGAGALLKVARRPFLLYVGIRASYKNFDGLLTAFARSGLHRHFDLLALGGGPLNAAEQAQIALLGLSEQVISIPYAPPDLLAEAYAQATLFVYPSLYEGFGIPPLEAMASETPALVARSPATTEVCGNAAIFFEPQDKADFAAKLIAAVEDEPLRRQHVDAGLALIPRYKWTRTAEQTLAAYRSLFSTR
ncbi:glycosyltransferase family 4 protein [Terriglobus roseus]|uniref:Glycosyltransferase involved in cell wall bisynthesis n=1 Tax=Terriglobus roseus TaxID=392734 RepID=A0A1H4NGU7_9BACT|nr:glycosyltransferase family 1 protein [Terriglobus roseus]SEB94125.1 Glycosyltransferase involved in cell wall bisynthesis [Terriglobus roseus]